MPTRLPLSWSFQFYEHGIEPTVNPESIWLPSSGRSWVHSALIRGAGLADSSFKRILLELAEGKKNPVLRGCNPRHIALMAEEGWHSRQTGIEATLTLDGPVPWHPSRSLRELERRAKKKGKIETLSTGDKEKWAGLGLHLKELRSRSHYSGRPTLEHLFLTDPSGWDRCCLFWQDGSLKAVVGWSRNGPNSRHLEVLMRSRDAPVGTMEALILESVRMACAEGFSVLSLGEVPFLHFRDSLHSGSPARYASYYFMRPAFSSMGLFRFKQKFKPAWTPLYLLSEKRVHPVVLFDLFWKSGCHRLLGYCLTHRNNP
ncbi:MAG: DUF2156 domain-containing protein [Leptospiraceae bacterium]|nr:DUF2156 domain-containing protein [Leptospiraceae bacterium]